jgi:hypothetical protein
MQTAAGCASSNPNRGARVRRPHEERTMEFFSKILEKLGIGGTAAAPPRRIVDLLKLLEIDGSFAARKVD